MALSSDNDSITTSGYKLEYNLDYYTNKFPAGTLVDLFDICELNFNTDDKYHRFIDSIVYTTLSNYKVQNSYNLNNRLVKKSDSSVRKFQPTVNSSSFKIADESAQFLIKGFSPRPINIDTSYWVDGQYHYDLDSLDTDNSTYKTDINIKNSTSKYYASSILDCDYSNMIFIWRNNASLGIAYYDDGDFTLDSDMLCVLNPRSHFSSLLYLPTNYDSQMPYVVTCILGGAGGGGSSGVDLHKFSGFVGIRDGYSRHSIYGGAGGGSGATLIMNLSFGTDTNPIGYLIEIGAGGAGGAASGDDATKDTYGRGSMQAGKNGGASYIYAYSYSGKNVNNNALWTWKVVNGNYTYFASAGGGGGGKAISSGEQPSYAEGGIAGTHSSVAQEYFQVIASFNGAKGGHGGCDPGSSSDDRYPSETELRSSSLENPPASGDDIMLAINNQQSNLGYVSFNTMAGLTSSKINFPSNYKNRYGTLISHKYIDGTPYYGAAGGGASSLLSLGGLGRAWKDSTDGSLGSGGGGGDFGTSGGYSGGYGGDGYVIIFY